MPQKCFELHICIRPLRLLHQQTNQKPGNDTRVGSLELSLKCCARLDERTQLHVGSGEA